MIISHISDVHIHNLKHHSEQLHVFEKVYEHLKAKKVDINVITGDLFHIKGNVTPEAYQMAADFLKSLADIAPTHIILGNHDLILSNKNRLDSVTPVVEALNHPFLFLHKHSEEFTYKKWGMAFNVMSIVDEQTDWIPISDPNLINIGLYHGSVAGVLTDQNWAMERGDIDVEKFSGFDYVLLGDIHKANQILDTEGRVRYAGSLCQNNFGDFNDKGFLIWDIKDKDDFKVEHIHIPNPKPFVNLVLENDGSIPKFFTCPEGSKVRVLSYSDISSDKVKKAIETVRKKYKPENVSYQNKAAPTEIKVSLPEFMQNGNLRDEEMQKTLIKEYLKDFSVTEEVLQEIYYLNEKFNKEVEAGEEISRNIHWRLKKLSWDNLFNYGEGNEIDFGGMKGIVGIFGKNFSGKSSIVDSLLFAIYNNTSKNIRKNLFVINQNKQDARCSVEIEVDGKTYMISRSLSRYTKKLKGEVTEEAKATVDFSCYDPVLQETTNLNGIDGNETNKNIRKIFGTIEDFFATSMSSQTGALGFINEGSTKRKEIIAKFLDLEIFESKFKLAKEESALVKAGLRRLEERDFQSEVKEQKLKLVENENQVKDEKEIIEKNKTEVISLSAEVISLEDKISKIDSENIDKNDVEKQLSEVNKELDKLSKENNELTKKVSTSKDYVKKAEDFNKQFNVEDLKSKKSILLSDKEVLLSLSSKISEQKKILSIYKNQADVLDKVPCGSTYTHSCDFIKEANEYLQKISVVELAIADDEKRSLILSSKIEALNETKIEEYLSKYQQLLDKKNSEEKNVAVHELAIEKNKASLLVLTEKQRVLLDKLKFYEEHKELIENMKCLIQEVKDKKEKIANFKQLVKSQEQELAMLYKEHGTLEHKIETIHSNEKEKTSLQRKYAAYELFMRCMHSNGIAFGLIKKNLPLINQEITKILSSVVDFEVFFENSDNKLDIFIKHPKYDARPLENGSGAEKTLAAMAIRIALINVTNMPKPNVFILDEPGTALDNDNMEGFVRILDLVKEYFETTVLISHIDQLKDSADMNIEISRNNGYAFVKC